MRLLSTPISCWAATLLVMVSLSSCKGEGSSAEEGFVGKANTTPPQSTETKRALSQEFKEYWYAGKAEITSYKLEQARYGELRDGKAVLIYVTEPFLKDKQVKPDLPQDDQISVLKLNSTKKFLTGIYPYSIMNSSFYPVHDNQHAIKLTSSIQEWCGQVFTQLNNRLHYEVNSFSYFESDGDQFLKLEKKHLENEVWNKIRINPENLPTGKMEMIPSLEYVRLAHKQLKAYEAQGSLETLDGISTYTITYPSLERTLAIHFSRNFPYTVEGWTETYKSGTGDNAKTARSTATKIKTLKRAYWQENKNKDVIFRDSLGL